ncbi:MAG: ATP-binding protein, partial [Verrucomicrobiales bacterium]|nr:ATP-binding protein [Verrucomicrobiales bacterium]
IEECNQAFRKMAAISAEGPLPGIYDLLVEEQKTPVKNLLANLSRDKSSIRLETLFQAGADNLREVHGVVSLVRETGQLAVQIEDVTNRRKMERRMANDEKNILLDTLVGGVAHEINNKLTPIIGFATLHMHPDDMSSEEEIRSSFQLIRDCATEASSIIAQLLQLSKPPASQMVVSDIRQIVEDTVSLLRFQAREAGCRLLFDPPAFDVPVKSDIAQLKQVLVNVVINAIHASRDEATPEVKLEVSRESDEIIVSVIDQGCGISPENLERIFDPFFTTKGPQKGNGLGLSVCRSIMAMHSGSIEVVSEAGLGTTMRLVLPVARPEQNSFRAQPEPTLPENDLRSGAATNILIVDDEPWLGKMIQKGLKTELGLDTVAVLDGRKAIEKIEDDDFDLIISDVRMPNMDGFKLFEWVCKNRPELSRRFLFITGDAGGKVFNERLSDLDAPVLRKPFDLRALSYQCNEMLADGRGNDSVALMN